MRSALLISMIILMMRAVLVPSTPLQTAVVSAFASLPAIGVAYLVSAYAPPKVWRYAVPVYAALWSLVTTVVATLASRVIYGLRSIAAFFREHPPEKLRAPTAPTPRREADSPTVVTIDFARRAPAK